MTRADIVIISQTKHIYDVLQQYNKYNLIWIDELISNSKLPICKLIIIDQEIISADVNMSQPILFIGSILANHACDHHFIEVPISIPILVKKIDQILSNQNLIKLNNYYCYNPELRLLIENEKNTQITLTEKENEIINYFINSKQSVSKKDLLKAIWHYDHDIESHTVETHIYRLRQKLIAGKELIDSDLQGYKIST